MRSRKEKTMKTTRAMMNNPYPDFEQSWLMQEPCQTITVPECGLIVTKDADGLVRFHDDEFPSFGPCIEMRKEEEDEQD